MKKRITIRDIAAMLSLTPSSVSRALSNHPGISDVTKQRVQEAVRELGYVPNLHARYFRQKRSRLIALIVPEFNMFFMPDLLQAVQDTMSGAGYSLIILHTNNDYLKEVSAIQHCMSWLVDGVLAVLTEHTTDLDHFEPLHDENTPVVIVDKILPTQKYSLIRVDDLQIAAQAATLLLESGCTHCLGIFAKSGLAIAKSREAGFTQAFENYSGPNESLPQYHVLPIDAQNDCEKTLYDYSEKYGVPDGIFTMSDEILVAAYRPYIKWEEQGKKKIKLIAVSDGKAPYYFHKRVSHILHSGYETGKKAALHLIERIRNPEMKASQLFTETEFVRLDTL